MAEYICKVGDTTGRIFQQLETAQSEGEARQKLSDRGLHVFTVKGNLNILSQFGRRSGSRKLKIHDFLIFNQQFNTLIKAGLPILKALDLLAERAAAEPAAACSGCSPTRARGRVALRSAGRSGFFPPVYVTVVAAGERSGNLSGVLEQYISYLRVSTGFRRR